MPRHGDAWARARAEYVERRATLDRLAALEAPTADELFARAKILEILSGADEALQIYRQAAEQGHLAASLAAGRVLLDRRDAAGVALVEASMDRDESLVPHDGQVWFLDPKAGTLTLRLRFGRGEDDVDGPDNISV